MSSDEKESAEAIRAAIAARVEAVRTKDVLAVLSGYALDVLTFDLVEPLSNFGSEEVRKRLVDWFGSFEGNIEYDLAKIELAVSGDVAFDHHFVHVKGKAHGGQVVDMWFRETIGYRKLDGAWKVVHQHSSVPFDMNSMTAKLDLEPERLP